MNSILLIILLLLLIWLSGSQGIRLFISIIINFILLVSSFILISLGMNHFITGIIICIILSWIVIFRTTEDSIKRKSTLISTLITIFIVGILSTIITLLSKTYGFGYESYEEINMFSENINISFKWIEITVILIGIVGAVIDASISIASSLKEIYENNHKLDRKSLQNAGMNIGSDIIGTTINTLIFAFFGESLTLLIYLNGLHYNILELVINKTFLSEVFKIIFSMLGSLMVIPLTAYITSYLLKKEVKHE